jgi:hypothetical protein
LEVEIDLIEIDLISEIDPIRMDQITTDLIEKDRRDLINRIRLILRSRADRLLQWMESTA